MGEAETKREKKEAPSMMKALQTTPSLRLSSLHFHAQPVKAGHLLSLSASQLPETV